MCFAPRNVYKLDASFRKLKCVLYLEDHGDISEKIKLPMPATEWVSRECMKKECDAKLYI